MAALVLMAGSVAGVAAAGEATAPKTTTLVKAFAGKDLPAGEAGKSAWEPANTDKWAYDIAVEGKWVYAVSAPARRLVRFERDPATGSMEYKEAIPFEAKDKESGGASLHVRRLPDGTALLYVFFSTHHESSLLCYAVDGKTGALAVKGKGDLSIFPNNDVGDGYGYPAFVWSPDQNRLYYVGVKKIVWYTFKEDGIPLMEGKGIACTNPGKSGRGRGHALLSPDGKYLYAMIEKMVPAGTVFWQADTYNCDPKTGGLTFNSTLDLPNLPQECTEFMGFSPGAKLLCVIDERAACYYALARDGEKGTLSILTSGKPDPSMNGTGGPPWARGGKWAFSGDGKTGYYLGNRAFGSFGADPATGALSGFSSIGGMWAKLAFDPASGNLFLVGGAGISAFKTPAGQ
ncbi:MAG: hypothetical protein NTW87_27695 [Planctomycetota bacterium]|nr:hypothetical protein [Planctomycetota bacterium]